MQYQPDVQEYQHPSANPSLSPGTPDPGSQNFLMAPYMPALPDIPPGLEYLTQVDEILIHQKGYSTSQSYSAYEIFNAVNQRIFYAIEERECCGPVMDVWLYDNSETPVLHLLQPSNCCSCEEVLEVYSPTSGYLIGYVVKNGKVFSTNFSIFNMFEELVLEVVGPGFTMACFKDINFEVRSSDETYVVGHITRVWRGFRKEMFSTNDHYSVQFPIDLDANIKALLLSTTIFIDFLYFDQRRRSYNN